MISWIQRYFHKHFRLVFLLILAAMAIPLVVIFSPSSGAGRAGSKILERPFFGVNLGNEDQKNRVFSDGNLSAQLGPRFAAFAAREDVQEYALKRVAGLALADELHLPAPTADQVARFVTTLRVFQNEQGQFDQKRYAAFGDSLKTGSQLSTADVNRVLRDDTRLEQLNALTGGPGYVLPGDVRQQLIRADTNWTVQVAIVDYASFNPTINASDEALKKFYEENSFRYDVPARPRFSYVEFKGADFLPPVGPTEAEARAFYNANAGSFPVPPADPAKKEPAPATGPVDNFPKVRAQVEAAMKNSASARLASKAANELTVALFEHKFAANSPELATFLAGRHLPIVAVTPFAPDNPPSDKPWLASYTEQISQLNKSRYFSDPLATSDSFVVLLWNDSLAPYKPVFTEVHDRVATDFKDGEKRRLFIAQGQTLRAQLQAAAKTAGGFSAAATSEKIEIKSYANVSRRQPPEGVSARIFSTLEGMEAGQVSEMVATADKGYLVYAQEKKLPDLNPGSLRYVELQTQLMRFTTGINQSAYLGELVERELKKTKATDAP